MTDYEKTKDLLDSFGITGYDEGKNDSERLIRISELCCDKVTGYTGFFIMISFSKEGKFNDIGIWE